jgi:Conserved hypothetical protein 698
MTLIDYLHRLLPGIVLCIAITIAALFLQTIEVGLVGQPYLEALVLAILLGVAIRSVWRPGPRWIPGIDFSAKLLLEVAIVMLGASVSAATILALGPILIVGIAGIVAVAIACSYLIGGALGLPQRMSILIACGNSICGNSAIATIAPVIGADSDDVASSISFTAVLGVVVVLGLPLLVPIFAIVADAIRRACRLDGLCGAAGPRRDLADRRTEQPSRHRHQARARADARTGGAGVFFAGREIADGFYSPRAGEARTASAGTRAVVYCRLSGRADRALARPHPAESAAADHPRSRDPHDHRHGGAWSGC